MRKNHAACSSCEGQGVNGIPWRFCNINKPYSRRRIIAIKNAYLINRNRAFPLGGQPYMEVNMTAQNPAKLRGLRLIVRWRSGSSSHGGDGITIASVSHYIMCRRWKN
jgi:hypothetical protein